MSSGDIDIWVDDQTDNIVNANNALTEFGSPYLLTLPVRPNEILQLGVAPDRIDILLSITGLSFDTTWPKRIVSKYGQVDANWIDIDSLIDAKSRINSPRHQDDVDVLLKVKKKLK